MVKMLFDWFELFKFFNYLILENHYLKQSIFVSMIATDKITTTTSVATGHI